MSDVEVRYKRGNDMVLSAVLALKALLPRFEAGEADDDGRIWTWPEYRDERFRVKAARGEKPLSIRWADFQHQAAEADDPEAFLAGERARKVAQRSRALEGGGFEALCKAWDKADHEARSVFSFNPWVG